MKFWVAVRFANFMYMSVSFSEVSGLVISGHRYLPSVGNGGNVFLPKAFVRYAVRKFGCSKSLVFYCPRFLQVVINSLAVFQVYAGVEPTLVLLQQSEHKIRNCFLKSSLMTFSHIF